MKKFFRMITNKWLLKGTSTLILIALVIACYIGANWGIEQLNIDVFDFTAEKLYTLSDETQERLQALEDEITIKLINVEDFNYGEILNGEYVIEYIEKYTTVTDKIKIEKIDDVTNRVDIQNEYGITAEDSIIVVKNGETEKIVPVYSLMTYDFETSEYIDTTEEIITNAVVEVTLEEKPKIYVFNGNTFYNAEQSMALVANGLMSEANDVELLDILSKGNVPEDCDCLIITTLRKDLTEKERDEILKYINNGGKIMMLTSQTALTTETPNLDQILAQYGIKLGFGAVYEQDGDRQLADSPDMIIADVNASYLRDIDMSLRMVLMTAGNIKFEDSTKLEELGVTYEAIATTGETSFERTDFNQDSLKRTDKDSEEGACTVGAFVTKKISDDKKSELIIFADELSSSTVSINYLGSTYALYLYNNEDVIMNSVSHLTEREDTIKIRKTKEVKTYTVTEDEDVVIKTIIFTVPIIVIFIGIAVWIYRRRKS